MTLLQLLSPVLSMMPNVSPPQKRVTTKEKLYWTIMVLLIYLVFSQMPLFGITVGGSDPFHWVRVIMASNRGTLMELGISPLMSSSLLIQLLMGAGFFTVDQSNPSEKQLFDGAQKLLGILMTLLQSLGYIYGGMYGNPSELPFRTIFLVVIQLLLSGLVLMILDDLMQNGWGIGSGSNLFIATNYCEAFFWRCFSPASYGGGRDMKFEGSVISLIHLLITRKSKMRALKEALFRVEASNISNLIVSVLIFAIVVYLQGFKIEIPIRSIHYKNYSSVYPIRLFYTSSMPLIFHNAIVSNLFFISQFLSRHFSDNILVKLLGVWDSKGKYGEPIGGFIYYISAPNSIYENPFRFFSYSFFTIGFCGLFSRLWIEMGESSPKEIVGRFVEQGLTVRGFRKETFIGVFYRFVPVAAWAGGVMVGVLTIMSEILGASGSGTGVLLAVNTIWQFYSSYSKERSKENVVGMF